ncbi:uncharacterized protein L203_106357 [Cryptococcus depauperatus CBS 7841]|uniref:Uncharacterized protein n=1 Tax=Cryptococcus depauperatus CBS 7841 TaxID=1295531 RepID=A0A1E3IJ59_9TREE|nr:hypothetical protein L203_02642 [Cryptococcus depauperatus CBS 7841]
MSKASASSARSDNSSGNSRPPPYRRVAEISAAPLLATDSQASGTSMGSPASTQPGPARIPARIPDWDNDTTVDSKSSFELLLDWLDLPNTWQRFAAGSEGCSAAETSKQCPTWLACNFRPTKRTPQACRKMHDAFYKADDYRNGIGEGAGQYRINKAQGDDERARIEESADGEPFPIYFYHCQRLCPGFFRLGLDYKEGDFGQRCYRDDSTLSANPALTGFEEGLHARKAQRDAAFADETTPAALED